MHGNVKEWCADWSVQEHNGKRVATGIVEGVGKQIGRPLRVSANRDLSEPSVMLRFTDTSATDEFKLNIMAMALVGPFSKTADDDDLTEAAIWPELPVAIAYQRRLEDAPWIYDYEMWRNTPDRAVWYLISTDFASLGKRAATIPPIASSENVDATRVSREAGADINARDVRGRTALYRACSSANDNRGAVKVEALLDDGADPNVGMPPLLNMTALTCVRAIRLSSSAFV